MESISEKISRVYRPLGIQTTFSSGNTLRKSLTKVKGSPGMMDVKGVVYSIPGAEGSVIYIGETGRTLKVRIVEHKRVVKNKDPKNGITVHVQMKDCTYNQLARSKDPCKGGQLGKKDS